MGNKVFVDGESVSLKVRPHIDFHHIKTSSSFLILTFKSPLPYKKVAVSLEIPLTFKKPHPHFEVV
jgi:hypothetical protein